MCQRAGAKMDAKKFAFLRNKRRLSPKENWPNLPFSKLGLNSTIHRKLSRTEIRGHSREKAIRWENLGWCPCQLTDQSLRKNRKCNFQICFTSMRKEQIHARMMIAHSVSTSSSCSVSYTLKLCKWVNRLSTLGRTTDGWLKLEILLIKRPV